MFEKELVALTTICFAAMTGGLAMLRVKQPALIGYILAGVILGPTGLALVEESEHISVLAELGVTLLLFLVGMELSVKTFQHVWKIALGSTALQILLAVTVTCGLGLMLGWTLNKGIMLGFALAMSSTAVAIKIFENTDTGRKACSRLAVSVLIAQDLALVPMLLIISALGETGGGFGISTVMQVFGAVAILAGIFWFLGRQGRYHLPVVKDIELETSVAALVSLTTCFLFAAVAGAFGLSTAFGAFIAGLIIGNSREREQFVHVIRPIQEVLMMVFFLSIGLLIDLGFVWDNLFEVMLLLFVTLALKTIGNKLIFRLMGVDKENRVITSLVLAQVGEFSFIIGASGLAAGMIQAEGYRMLVAVIALSLAVSPVWFEYTRYVLGQPIPERHKRFFDKVLAMMEKYRLAILGMLRRVFLRSKTS